MLKRIFDIVVSLIAIIILAPLLVGISVWVGVSSRGGVFYLQKRVGRNNRDFRLIKFRTMVTDADKKGLLTVGGRDPRITNAGYSLRKYKLDELPQLFNVLAGSMSIVGPRPEVRKYVDMYTEEQKEVLKIKPGITDYASLEYYSENELLAKSAEPEQTYIREIMPAKLALNKKYISEANLLTDMKIIAGTVKRMMKG
jgi:lipopolysaccharide/colanic/teichoic acid biosynthesis glycosyltransferase